MKKILVTGSSGTIGTALCEKLLELGYDVRGVDIKQNKWNKTVDSLTIIADLRKKKNLKKIEGPFNLVIHLAANARVYDLVKKPELAKDNVVMMFNVLEFARKNKVQKIVFASSREVYGNTEKFVHVEEDARIEDCESPYTASKIAGEALVHSYRQCYEMDSVIIRFSNVYGRYDESNRVVPLFFRYCREGKALKVFGKEKMLDFTYIDDAVDGIVRIVDRFDSVKNQVMNVAYGEGSTILQVAELIQKEMDVQAPVKLGKSRTGEVMKYVADITKAKQVLQFQPKIALAEGIQKSVEWYKKNT